MKVLDAQPTALRLELRNLKIWNGMEGGAFQYTLYVDGKRAAEVTEEGVGGELEVRPFSSGIRHGKDYDALIEKLDAYAKTLPPDADGDPQTWDGLLYRLVDDYENDRRLRRKCRTCTLFRTTDCGPDEFYAVKVPYTPALAERLRAKHGAKLTEIINERFLSVQGKA